MFIFYMLISIMTSQRAIKQAKRLKRRSHIRLLKQYIDWCKSNVTIRTDDNQELPLTTEEALEFIIFTKDQSNVKK